MLIHRRRRIGLTATTALAVLVASAGIASAAQCGNGPGSFDRWLGAFKREAAAKGISGRTLARALDGVTYHARVVRLDRSQHSFKLSFKQFYRRRVGTSLMKKGRARLKRYARTLQSIEKRYGVPPEIIVAIWGLETNYGAGSGKMNIIRSLATLAYDCRRTAFFTNELIAALRIVQRGDMSPAQLRGGWAGEIGQTQFLASSYYKYAVDWDGNGRRDLIRSVPDVLASTANFLRAHGWQRGAGWGPGTANYGVLRDWNRADVYRRTIATVANKFAGR